MHRVPTILCCLLLVVPAFGDEKGGPAEPLTGEQGARIVLKAWQAKDTAAFSALAAKDAPDPWFVAEELCRSGHKDVAVAFAKAAPRVVTKDLPAFVASWRSTPEVKAAFQRAEAAMQTGDFNAALDILRDAAPDDSAYGIGQLHLRAVLLTQLGKFRECVPYWARASERAEKLGWVARAAKTALSGAQFATQIKDFAALTTLAKRATRHYVALGDMDLASYGRIILGLGYMSAGQNARAIDVLEENVRVGDRIQNIEVTQLTNMTLAGVYRMLGDYERALRYFRATDEIVHARKRWSDAVNVGTQIGETLRLLKRKEEAVAQLKKTLALASKHKLAADEARLHLALGDMQLSTDPAEAEQYLLRAKATFEQGGLAYELTQTRIKLAEAAAKLDRPNDALREATSALAGAEETQEPRLIHEVLMASARIYRQIDKPDGARQHAERALGIAEAEGAPWLLVATHNLLAQIHLGAGEMDEAFASWRRMADVHRLEFVGLSDEEAAKGLEQYATLWGVPVLAAVTHGRTDDAFYLIESARSVALREVLGGTRALADVEIPEALRAEEKTARTTLVDARQALIEARRTFKRRAIREAREKLTAARAAREAVVRRIQREAKAAASVAYPRAPALAESQHLLQEGEATVLYALAGDQLIALVVGPTSARGVALGSAAVVNAAAEQLIEAAREPKSVAPDVAALRKLLVEPLGLGKHVRRVLVSPTGRLGYVPFGLLLPGREVAYAPSAMTHDLLLAGKSKPGALVFAVGDPEHEKLRALPAARKEAQRIGDVVVVGAHATEQRLSSELAKQARWRAFHLACHGVIDPEEPLRSFLALTAGGEDDGQLTALEIFQMKIPADLVVLSACDSGRGKVYATEGIVGLTRAFMFAGAPRVICSLWKVDDDATQALMVKFYELWNPKPDDGRKGLGVAAALREAQAHVRDVTKTVDGKRVQPWRHPYYWAAWTLWGLPE